MNSGFFGVLYAIYLCNLCDGFTGAELYSTWTYAGGARAALREKW